MSPFSSLVAAQHAKFAANTFPPIFQASIDLSNLLISLSSQHLFNDFTNAANCIISFSC